MPTYPDPFIFRYPEPPKTVDTKELERWRREFVAEHQLFMQRLNEVVRKLQGH